MRPRKQVESTASEGQQATAMTPDELALFHRVSSEEHEWQTITAGDMEDFSLELDPMRLPPCFQKLTDDKQFAFRWVENKPEPVDRRRRAPVPFTWYIVNSTAPLGIRPKELAKYIDSVSGAVVRSDTILMYKPWWMHEKRNEIIQRKSQIQEQGGVVKNRDGQEPKEGIKYLSGEKYKIGDSDVVIQDEAQVEHLYGQGQETQSGDLDDLSE